VNINTKKIASRKVIRQKENKMEELERIWREIQAELEQHNATMEKIQESIEKTAQELAIHNAIITSIRDANSPDYEIHFTPDFSTEKLN
jgi:restriction endonuclease